MDIKILGIRKVTERIDQCNPLWAATQEPHLVLILNNLPKALSQHATQSGIITKLRLKSIDDGTDIPLGPLGERQVIPNQVFS